MRTTNQSLPLFSPTGLYRSVLSLLSRPLYISLCLFPPTLLCSVSPLLSLSVSFSVSLHFFSDLCLTFCLSPFVSSPLCLLPPSYHLSPSFMSSLCLFPAVCQILSFLLPPPLPLRPLSIRHILYPPSFTLYRLYIS
jgi:hypothetical protein